MYWVAVSAEFQCRACGHLSPLNYLDLDGSVKCLRCGLDQAFARSSWKTAIEHAHAVGDLGGSPEGRHPHPHISIAADNPYRDTVSARHQQSGFAIERGVQVPVSLAISASIAQPSCEKCRAPLLTERGVPGEVKTRCATCGETRSYRLPLEATGLVDGLVGVMAGEHRSDQLVTRVEVDTSQPELLTLRCPSCGANLPATSATRHVVCGFCRTSSRLPEKTFFRGGRETATAEQWWLAFEGPSLMRRRLERDPTVPCSNGDDLPDGKIETPPKRKHPPLAEVLMVVLLPLLFLLAVGLADRLIVQRFDLDLRF